MFNLRSFPIVDHLYLRCPSFDSKLLLNFVDLLAFKDSNKIKYLLIVKYNYL